MLYDKTLAVVVPAYNEETQIRIVVETMPDIVDSIIIVNDCSTDNTLAEVEKLQKDHPKLHLIPHQENQGVGGCIVYCRLDCRIGLSRSNSDRDLV